MPRRHDRAGGRDGEGLPAVVAVALVAALVVALSVPLRAQAAIALPGDSSRFDYASRIRHRRAPPLQGRTNGATTVTLNSDGWDLTRHHWTGQLPQREDSWA